MYTSSGIKRILLPTLWAGASVVCTPGFAADSFLGWIEEFQPTFYAGTLPSIGRCSICSIGGARLAHSLRFAISTSAPMPEAMHARFEATLGVPLLQAYAMTEIGAIAQSPLPPGERRAGSVGLAAGCEVAVMDASWTRCRPGEVGEIVVRGPEVFAGYEGDAEATAAAFRDGWFRTGDLGYLDETAYLYLSGRAKDLINRGGFKVSPAEVDAALLDHPAVLDAATFGVAHPTLGEDVAAAVVVRALQVRSTCRQLRDFPLERLTAFKVPSRVMEVEAIPRTALGKVRRRELGEAFARPAAPALRGATRALRDPGGGNLCRGARASYGSGRRITSSSLAEIRCAARKWSVVSTHVWRETLARSVCSDGRRSGNLLRSLPPLPRRAAIADRQRSYRGGRGFPMRSGRVDGEAATRRCPAVRAIVRQCSSFPPTYPPKPTDPADQNHRCTGPGRPERHHSPGLRAKAERADGRQPVVIINHGGVGGTIGAEIAARAPADGYTLFFGGSNNLVLAPAP